MSEVKKPTAVDALAKRYQYILFSYAFPVPTSITRMWGRLSIDG